jgi:hypothetical protein
MKMVRTISLMAILLMLGSCEFPLFLCPLSNPDEATPDKSIEGVWHTRDDKGSAYFIHITSKGKNHEIVCVVHHKDGGAYVKSYIAFVTKLKNGTFLCAREAKFDPDAELAGNFYQIFKLHMVKENQMKIWVVDDNKIKEKVKSKEINGGASREIFGTVVIVENTERLQKIFSEDEGEGLMRCIGTYIKLETKPMKGK